jgi:two-component system CheB/CheR fusion protein
MDDSNRKQNNENLLDRVEDLEAEVAVGKRTDTAHKATEVRLQDALDYVQSIVDTVREPMLVLDEALRVRTASQAFYDTFAVPPDKTIGKYVYDLGNGQWGIPNLRMLLEDILPKEHVIRDFEIDHDFPMLGPRVMLLNARRLSGESNGAGHVLLAIEDITERKRIEAELRRSKDDLESFAYIAAHDLRSPLNSGLSLLQLLTKQSKGLTDEDLEILNLATANFRRLGTLMKDILSFSVASNAAQHPRMISLEDPLKIALANIAHHIEQKGAKVHVGKLPAVRADSTQMIMVFQNLVGNAVKYHRNEPPQVQIEAVQEGSYCHVSVRDNGEGFDAEHASTVFEPFKRLHGAEVPGSGIGLATCKRIIERLGGRLWAESTVGVGSIFHFTLPVWSA